MRRILGTLLPVFVKLKSWGVWQKGLLILHKMLFLFLVFPSDFLYNVLMVIQSSKSSLLFIRFYSPFLKDDGKTNVGQVKSRFTVHVSGNRPYNRLIFMILHYLVLILCFQAIQVFLKFMNLFGLGILQRKPSNIHRSLEWVSLDFVTKSSEAMMNISKGTTSNRLRY